MKGKRTRNVTWEDYGISKNRYRELKAFCLQYDEKKRKIERGTKPMRYDGMPGGGLTSESPVETQAIRNAMYLDDIRMIEEAAIRTNPVIWKYLLRSVTQDMPYEYIEYDEELGKIPIGRNDFYGERRKFFSILDEMKIFRDY